MARNGDVSMRERLAGVKGELKSAGITHDVVAAEAGVVRTMVVNVFAGRTKSQNVLDTAERLLQAARRKSDRPRRRSQTARKNSRPAPVPIGS